MSSPTPPAPVRPAPRLAPPVTIMLDRERTLRMDFAAMALFEEETGLSPWSPEVWSANPSPKVLSALLWAALTHEDPDLTLSDARRLPGMELSNYGYLMDRLADLWGETMPEADRASTDGAGDADPNPQKPARRAG